MCEKFGTIVSTKAIIDNETNKCKGYGFVDFAMGSWTTLFSVFRVSAHLNSTKYAYAQVHSYAKTCEQVTLDVNIQTGVKKC